MHVSCDQCKARYELDLPPADRARGRKLKFRCTSCGHRFVVVREDGSLTRAAAPPTQASIEAPTVAMADEQAESGPPTIELEAQARTEPPPARAGAADPPPRRRP